MKPEIDDLNTAIFSRGLLYTDLECVKEHLKRWKKAVEEHEKMKKEEKK